MKNEKCSLQFVWKKRLELRAEGNKLQAEGFKLWVAGEKLCTKGEKLLIEGYKLYTKGNELWEKAIKEVYGNIKLEWKNYNSEKGECECHLETGEIFKP